MLQTLPLRPAFLGMATSRSCGLLPGFGHPRRGRQLMKDDEAVKVLLDKLLSGGSHQQRREKLLKALDEASQRYSSSAQKVRKAFFHAAWSRMANLRKRVFVRI